MDLLCNVIVQVQAEILKKMPAKGVILLLIMFLLSSYGREMFY